MKSCDIYSNSPVSSIKQVVGYTDNTFNNTFNGCTIYICNSAIPDFVNKINNIKHKFILVSGDADETIPNDIFINSDFIKFIENDKIIAWYAQNCIATHPKLFQIPIGLDYHTINHNKSHSWGDNMSPIEQEKELDNIRKNMKPFWDRNNKCYSNFHFNLNSNDRNDAFKNINKDLVYYEPEKQKRLANWQTQTNYCFVISPHGNGLDCHRTWEALLLECIPIVKTSPLDPLYDDLPVLIVKQWSDITQELLNKTIDEYKNKHLTNKFNYDKLLLKYWMDLIKTKRIN